MSADERAVMQRHVEYWTARMAEGHVVGFGPVVGPNGGYGVALIRAESDEQARRLADADPAITAGAGFAAEILPMAQLVTPQGSTAAG
jgi:uncharacterized protein YciI